MASTYSNLKVELMGTGDQANTWGDTTNNNFKYALGQAITSSVDVAFSSSNVTLTWTDTNGAQSARYLRLNLTGTSGGARDLTVPVITEGKFYIVNNNLADDVTVKCAGGVDTGTVVKAGTSGFVYNNATSVLPAISYFSGAVAATTLTATTGTITTLSATNLSSTNYTGNLTFTTSGARILGDFSNATVTNRLSFQTSTVNGTTGIYALPNGTGTAASFQLSNAADPTNASKLILTSNGSTDVQINSSINGTGTYLPLSFYTGGILAAQITTGQQLTVTSGITSTRVTPRFTTVTSSATPTINTDTVDVYGITALAVDITSFTTNLSGTPTDGQKLHIYIVGTATRTLAWGASFEASTAALPTTTVSTNRLDVGFIWNAASSKWRCLASG